MAGVSLRGTVEQRGGVVYLKLDMDGADGKALHPYSWIPPTGNVMYCMPQEGTEAYLYFPEAEEGSAYAVSGIHNSSCPVFADAQSRGLVTEHGKKMQLYAEELGFLGGQEEAVQECRMGEDGIHFGAGKGKLQVTGSGQITFRASEISLDAVQKIGQYKMESMAKEKAGMLYSGGNGNPSTGGGGDGAAELQNEYNALSSQGILAGTEYEYYKPFDDAPEYEEYKEVPTWLKPCVQAVFSSDNNNFSDSNSFSIPTNVIEEPIIALFDGVPQANHPLLKGMLMVDDPDGFESFYEVRERVHGTAMASLILRGQDMSTIEDEIRKVYVRPIMKPETWSNKVTEYIPDDFLLVDKIHEAVRRLFEPEAGQVASNVRIINLSIGIRYREFYNIISPLARLLDWLSYKYRVLFIVSAGNHPEAIDTGLDFNDFKKLSDEDKDAIIIKFIDQDIRNRRLLSPAESMNALTVGATFTDNNDENPIGPLAKLCSDNIPAVYGSFGSGINNAIKPDIFFPGGRNFVHEDYMHRGVVRWRESSTRAPGISSAAPGLTTGAIVNKAFSFGTSDATALVTNKAQECYAVLDEIFMKETGMGVPNEYVAVLIKAMLAHGASWNGWDRLFQGILGISGNSAKNALHRYLGYGEPDVERVKECTKEQVTLIGFGDIAQDKAFIYSIPIPIEFHEKSLKRKLTVTLAYLSPIHPSSIKYREKQVWVTINNGNSLIGSRAEYDYHAVQRGTLQHEIFENDSIEVWDIDQSIELKVNCRGCASENNPEMLIPYALFATFEMAPDCGVDVYQKVVDKVQVKNAIKTV